MLTQNKRQERQEQMGNDSREAGENADQELLEDAIVDKVTAILGFTELLLVRKPQDPLAQELLTKAWDTARDLADLIYRTRRLRQESENQMRFPCPRRADDSMQLNHTKQANKDK